MIAGGVANRTILGQADDPNKKSKSKDTASKSFVSMLDTHNEPTSMKPLLELKEKKMNSIFSDVDLLLEDMTSYKKCLKSVKNMFKAKLSAVTSIFQVKLEPNPNQF